MKIIHVTDELMPSAGGLVSVPINLAAAQAALGHEVFLLGRTGKEQLIASGETEKIPSFGEVVVEDANHPGLTAKLIPIKTLSLLKKHITPGSIVHLHGVWDPILLMASKVTRKRAASYIVTPHSMLHPWQMERYVWQKKIVFAIGWRSMFNKAALIHTLNQAENEFVKGFGFKASIEIIPNGIYPESFVPVEPNSFLEQHPQLASKPYILFLSRLSKQKGIEFLLDGFERLASSCADIHLVIAGPDYGELLHIQEKLKRMKHADRVLLPGPLYGDDKLGVLHGASCFALTSRTEGFSIAILEALACSLPVVISKNCYFPEVEKYEAGFITDLDSASVSAAFSKILSNETLRQTVGKNARRLVSENYTWDHIARKTTELYRELLHV